MSPLVSLEDKIKRPLSSQIRDLFAALNVCGTVDKADSLNMDLRIRSETTSLIAHH